jgi:hypothetical protein
MKWMLVTMLMLMIGSTHAATEPDKQHRVSVREQPYFDLKHFADLPSAKVQFVPAAIQPVIIEVPKPESSWEKWIGIGTLGLVVATFMVYLVTRALVTGDAESTERELRAYVLPCAVGIRKRPKEAGINDPDRYFVEVQNNGKTPAYYFSSWLALAHREYELGETPLPPQPWSSRSHIGAGVKYSMFAIPQVPLSQEERIDILAGHSGLYLYGELSYTDIFKKELWRTKFKFVSTGEIFGMGEFIPYKDGNDADVKGPFTRTQRFLNLLHKQRIWSKADLFS